MQFPHYPIIQVDPVMVIGDESMGTKSKFWFRYDDKRWLFKEARENTGEDWAEKIAAEIAKAFAMPAAMVELAEYKGKAGCASLRFLDEGRGDTLIHGNEILAGTVTGYDKTKMQRQSDHTLENIKVAICKLCSSPELQSEVFTRLACYAVLDALIGNVDRHHENWGLVLRVTNQVWAISVAPSFDHASSLGRELRDERRTAILNSNRMEKYVRSGRGGVYLSPEDPYGANPLRLVEFGGRRLPEYFQPALGSLRKRPVQDLHATIDRVPPTRMSSTARTFAKALVSYTYSTLCTLNP